MVRTHTKMFSLVSSKNRAISLSRVETHIKWDYTYYNIIIITYLLTNELASWVVVNKHHKCFKAL